jgi:hypothetical protein
VHARIGVHEAHAVGPDHADPCAADLVDQGGLAAAPRVTHFGEAGGDHDDTRDALGHAFVDGRIHELGRDRDHGQIHRTRDVGEPRVAGPAQDLPGLRIDRHELAAIAVGEVVEDLGADLPALAAGPDDRHDFRLEEPLHRREGGPGRALCRVLLEGCRGRDREDDLLDAALDPPLLRLEAAVAEHVDHPAVVAEDVRLELRDSMSPCDLGQPLEQARSHALPLQSVLDGERDLGAVRVAGEAKVVGDRDDAVCRFPDQGELAVVVHVAELPGPAGIDTRHREEPEVEAVGRQPPVERVERLGVLGTDRPQAQRGAGSQDDVPLFFDRVCGARRRAGPGLLGWHRTS